MTRNQQIRDEVLLQLYGAGQRIGLSADHMARTAKRNGDDFTADEITEAGLFLVGNGFAEQVRREVTGEVRFRITSAGVNEYETTQ
jgi:hypothetical protein